MILGIGTDIVRVARFENWHTKSRKQLQKIFSDHEIDYSLENPRKSAQRFAARFAAKEAFYKAYSQVSNELCARMDSTTLTTSACVRPLVLSLSKDSSGSATGLPSLTIICKLVSVEHRVDGAPILKVNCQQLGVPENMRFHVSISHEKEYAMGVVLIEIFGRGRVSGNEPSAKQE